MSLLDQLFDEASEISSPDYPDEEGLSKISAFVRCKCGELFSVLKPTKCEKCGDLKCYWTLMDGSVKRLEDMDMGHLTNAVKMLARKLEVDGPKLTLMWRESMELAIDLFYREIGSRDKEIEQASGIMAALNRSLDAKKPDADVP